jgi:pimeloyl-ACP methyl ester carboxylesterase
MTLVAHELGDPARPPLVFLHALGVGPSGRYVSEIAPLLRRRVLGVDGAGFGDSRALDAAEYELPSYVPRVIAVLDSLRLERAALMGHSWGGVVACQVAASAPERVSALVLLDSGHLDYGDQPGFDPDLPLETWIENSRARQWAWPSREAFLAELRDDATRLTPEYEQAVLAGMTVEPDGSLRSAPPEVRGAVYRAVSRARSSETWAAIAAAGIPTLLLLATEPPDRAAENESGAERLRAAIPAATVVAVPGSGHDLIADAGPDIAAVIADWLDANAPG